MKNRNKELKRYYREIKGWLPCVGKLKRKILAEIKDRVSLFLDENPETTFFDIQTHFGSPRQIAAAYTNEMSTQELLSDLRINRRVTRILTSAAAIALALWISALSIALIHNKKSDIDFIEASIGSPQIVEEGK